MGSVTRGMSEVRTKREGEGGVGGLNEIGGVVVVGQGRGVPPLATTPLWMAQVVGTTPAILWLAQSIFYRTATIIHPC